MFEGDSVSHGELERAIRRAAAGLRAAGVEPGRPRGDTSEHAALRRPRFGQLAAGRRCALNASLAPEVETRIAASSPVRSSTARAVEGKGLANPHPNQGPPLPATLTPRPTRARRATHAVAEMEDTMLAGQGAPRPRGGPPDGRVAVRALSAGFPPAESWRPSPDAEGSPASSSASPSRSAPQGGRRRLARDRRRIAHVPDRAERRRQVDAARVHLRLPSRRHGGRAHRRARRSRGGRRTAAPGTGSRPSSRRRARSSSSTSSTTRRSVLTSAPGAASSRACCAFRGSGGRSSACGARRARRSSSSALDDLASAPAAVASARAAAAARDRARARAAAERAPAGRAGRGPARRREGASDRGAADACPRAG